MKAKIAAVVAVLMLPILFGFVLVMPAQAVTGTQLPDVTWLKGTIDNTSTAQQWLSETVDPSGFTHISYFDSSLSVLMYATNAGGSWATHKIADTNNGRFSAIASDKNGVIHLAFYDSANAKLFYMKNTAGTWSSPVLIDAGGKYVSMAVDVNFNVEHVAYQDVSGQKVMYADNLGGTWNTPVVVDSTGTSEKQGISIGTNNLGDNFISYRESVNSQLRFASSFNGSWNHEQISGTGLVAPFTSISMNDVSNKVTIIFYNQTSKMLKSIDGSSGSWTVPLTIDSVAGATYASIVMDSNLGLHVAYYDTGNETLKYAVKTGDSWSVNTVDTKVDATGVCSIDLDSNNKVHLAYMSATSRLMYVTSSASKWTLSTVESPGNIGADSTISVDRYGTVRIAYFDDTNKALKLATNSGTTWNTIAVDNTSSGVVGFVPSMTVGSNGYIYISYYDIGIHALKYASYINGNWLISTLDQTNNVGTTSSIAVDPNGTVHISYFDRSSGNLKYATNPNGSWNIMAVDPSNNVKDGSAIILDSRGKVHIAYNTAGGLKIATNQGGSWTISTVDAESGTGGACVSMVVAKGNTLHISYYDSNINQLKYAVGVENSWTKYKIDSSGQFSCIVLDSKGQPRIAYSLVDHLRVAELIEGRWLVSDVNTNNIGPVVSMARDQYDRLHVSYYSQTDADLLYAVSVTNPSSPNTVNGTRGDHFVRLTWTVPSSTGGAAVDSFNIYRGTASGAETLIGSVGGDVYVYNDTSVGNTDKLYYKVVAVNSEGSSLASTEFTINSSSGPTTDNSSLMLLVIAGVIAIVVIAVAVILVMRRVRPKNKWKQ